MAYDDRLADRVRAILQDRPGITERRMMGGLAFLCDGRMCGGVLGRCFAAVWPFVFVGTVNGVAAYDVADPSNGSPPAVTVGGLAFLPQYIVASGRRVYFVGNPAQAAPDYRLAIAWLDVPGDPLVTALSVKSLFVTYPHASIAAVFPTTDSGIFLVNGDWAWELFKRTSRNAMLKTGLSVVAFTDVGLAWDAPRWDLAHRKPAWDAGVGIGTTDETFRVYFARDLRAKRSPIHVTLRLARAY